MAAAADITTGLLHKANYQDDAASTVVAAAFGATGAVKDGGSAGDNTADLSVDGPGGDRPKAIRLDGNGNYVEFDIDDSSGTTCSMAALIRRTDQFANLDGLLGCYTTGSNAFALLCPGVSVDELGYQMGGYNLSHITETRLRIPIHEWVLACVAVRGEQAVITIIDLQGRVQQSQVVATHSSINFAGKIFAGWRGVSSGQHLAPIDIAGSWLWSRELTLVDFQAVLADALGSTFTAAQSTAPAVPIARGDADDATALLDGSKGRWLALGDSNMGDWVQAIDRLIVGQHGAVRGVCSRNVSGWQTFTAKTGVSATAHDSAVIGTAGTLKITRMDFNGGVAPSGAYTLRTINSVAIGTDSRYSTRDHLRDAYGYCPILRAKQLQRDLTLRVPIYKGPTGCSNAAVQIVLEYDGTEIVAGGGFSGYAATAGWVYETVTVPHGDLPDDFIKLTVHLCLVDGVTTQSGTYLWSAGLGVELYDPLIANGSMIHVAAEGGTQAEDFAATSYLTDQQYGLMALIAPDCYLLDFGVNLNTGADSAEDQRDGMLALIARLRSFSPSALVALKSAFAIYANHGGEHGQTPLYVQANDLAAQLTTNCLHVNVARMLIEHTIARGTARSDWSEHNAKHYFPALSLVLDSGTYYCAKQSHIKGSNSAPSSDTTNWITTGLTAAGLASDTGYASKLGSRHEFENTIHYDDPVHAHPYGHRLSALAFVTGLKWLAGLSDSEVLTAVQNLETLVSELGATPRINQPAGVAFRREVGRRSGTASGRTKVTEAITLSPGDIEEGLAFSVDMSPLFGATGVYSVGTPTMSDDTEIAVTALGPRDTHAMLRVSGTVAASETATAEFLVTMDTGTPRDAVRVLVELIGDAE